MPFALAPLKVNVTVPLKVDAKLTPRLSDVDVLVQILEEQEHVFTDQLQRLEPRTRVAVEKSLEKLLDSMDFTDVLLLAGRNESIVRRYALRALGRYMAVTAEEISGAVGDQVVFAMDDALRKDPHWEVRRQASSAFGDIGGAGIMWRGLAVNALAQSFHEDPDELVKEASSEALTSVFSAASLPELFTTLKEGESTARGFAVQALGERCAKSPRRLRWQVLPTFEPLLRKDSNWWVREHAVRALRRVGVADPAGAGTTVVDALVRFLSDEHVNFMVKRLKKDPSEVQLGNRIKTVCEEALSACCLSLAFLGWRLECQNADPKLVPSIVWQCQP